MDEILLRYIEVIGISFAAIGAVIFGFWQIMINKRLKKLQDFVAVSIVPESNPPIGIQIRNVGSINLYLKKVELGGLYVINYPRSRLISIGKNPFYYVGFPANSPTGQEIPIKLYFLDESDKKYLSEGAAIIDLAQIPIPPGQKITTQEDQQQAPTHISVRRVRAWTYKTIRYNWNF